MLPTLKFTGAVIAVFFEQHADYLSFIDILRSIKSRSICRFHYHSIFRQKVKGFAYQKDELIIGIMFRLTEGKKCVLMVVGFPTITISQQEVHRWTLQ